MRDNGGASRNGGTPLPRNAAATRHTSVITSGKFPNVPKKSIYHCNEYKRCAFLWKVKRSRRVSRRETITRIGERQECRALEASHRARTNISSGKNWHLRRDPLCRLFDWLYSIHHVSSLMNSPEHKTIIDVRVERKSCYFAERQCTSFSNVQYWLWTKSVFVSNLLQPFKTTKVEGNDTLSTTSESLKQNNVAFRRLTYT